MLPRRSGKGIRTPKPNRETLSAPETISLVLLLCLSLIGRVSAQVDTTISEQESQSVVLPCPVNEDKCGKLHSLNWFKGDDRIAAMLLGDNNVTSVNKEFEERVTVEQNPYRLVIKDLKIYDEDIYLCDTTFFIPEETCDNFNGYRIELRVLVPPTEVVILDAKGDRIKNGSIVGPMQERQSLKATCTVKNTRPQPEVGWFRGTKRLTTYSPTHDLNDGLYTSTLELDWSLSRDDLAQDIECRVTSAALPNTTVTKFSVDLQVRPTGIEINGVEHHTVQGSKVVLTCDIYGARPAVNLSWYNSTNLISAETNNLTEIRMKAFETNDGTYHTQSELIFIATRFENDRVFRCEAENVVLQLNREKPISSALTLEVLYPPVVKVSPSDIIANTSEIVLLNCEYVANPASLTQVEWYRNDELVNINDTDHYKGGNSENVALVIKSTEKKDIGNYSCQLSNNIGKGISDQKINLDVQYVPSVEILMIPEGPVKESDESNVTLFCNILDANPPVLNKVRWYANSTLLKELPDCEETREDLCHIDPSKLLLESIGRGFFYNYSCEGFNSAGWGPRSEDKELMVHYEPGSAALTLFPLVAVKKKSVTFTCSVDDPGYPNSNRFRWLRGGRGPLQDIVTKDWTVEPVGLDSRTNYSCYAFNEGGKGEMATVNLEVHAPPFFIKNLPPYTGILHTTANASLTCRIECVPRCEISWLKDGEPIPKNDTRYFVKEKYMESSPATGDFESMLSVLHFNISNWPLAKFDIEADNANYTCVSTGNTVGPSIRSRTYFGIEYAPDNTTVSENIVYVQEDRIPGPVICKSRANPEPSYKWFFKNETIANGNALIINNAMKRTDNGTYTCLAYNKHGSSTAETVIKVHFKPRCEIERREIDDQDTLICTAIGDPSEADFSWSIKSENETVESLGSGDKKNFVDKSFYILQKDYAISRTYRCLANNTVGSGPFCEIEVAEQLAFWQLWEKTTLIIVTAAILGLLLTVIIICCIIICICRRRRRQDKLHDKSSSLGEPLTEPGEYENLPFHGLQTAPNKSSTTPTNFNNNANSVRVAPRLKRLNGMINQSSANHQQDRQTFQHPHVDQELEQTHRLQYNTKHLPIYTDQQNQSFSGLVTPRQVHHNVINCFPKSITSTEYYQQQNQIQLQIPARAAEQFSTSSLSNIELSNSVELDCRPSFIVMERPSTITCSSLSNTNPFLAGSNFKKYEKAGEELLRSMPRAKHSKIALDMEKKFYSLKFQESKLKNNAHIANSSLGTTTSATSSATDVNSSSTCKRHNSFADHDHSDVDLSAQPVRLYDLPAYESMVVEDSANTNIELKMGDGKRSSNQSLATAQLHTQLGEDKIIKHHQRHHHHHQQPNDEGIFADHPLMDTERISIYRSDSGISNSSYESPFPIALSQKRPPNQGNVNTSSGSAVRKHVYKNIEAQHSVLTHDDSAYEPSSTIKTSESGAALINNCSAPTTCGTPYSISASSHYNLHQPLIQCKGNEQTTHEDFEQYRVGKQSANSVSTVYNAFSKSKVRSALVQCGSVPATNKKNKSLVINPFLASNGNNNTFIGNNYKKKLRRQTISDPYGHIQWQPYVYSADNCDVSKKSEDYRSEGVRVNRDSSKFQATSAEHMQINNTAKTSCTKAKHYKRLLIPNDIQLQKSQLGSLTAIDNLPSEIASILPIGSSSNGTLDCLAVRRPIRLPLRKHHTFHFQSTQTVKGKLQQWREQTQIQLRERKKFEQETRASVLRPLDLIEQHAFKPISLTPTIADSEEQKPRNESQIDHLELQPECGHNVTEADDDEDLGYSFCEEESMVDIDNYPTTDNLNTAPTNGSSTSKAIENATAGALEYFKSQSCCEVHI
ncbi:uncharacterized protein LOC108136874 isoform X9 [Drosophila elegans]|uniref:uncharacterized protein LOC108136874 isoform X9 n=1 Tax=Drosophila elegans TaxID=30023 RepID=UPI001BC83EBD|nr:uncharacterized protein LOC108136874 isoform X9 [Drosophila elegans]